MEQIEDMKQALVKVAYPLYQTCSLSEKEKQDILEELKKEYVNSLSDKLEAISRFLGENQWMAGEKLTYVDFFAYDVLDWNRVLFGSDKTDAFGNLKKYMERVENLKGVKEFLGNPEKFQRLPIFGPYAMFGQKA